MSTLDRSWMSITNPRHVRRMRIRRAVKMMVVAVVVIVVALLLLASYRHECTSSGNVTRSCSGNFVVF